MDGGIVAGLLLVLITLLNLKIHNASLAEFKQLMLEYGRLTLATLMMLCSAVLLFDLLRDAIV